MTDLVPARRWGLKEKERRGAPTGDREHEEATVRRNGGTVKF